MPRYCQSAIIGSDPCNAKCKFEIDGGNDFFDTRDSSIDRSFVGLMET